VVEQRRRPNKRVFRLTDATRAELHDFTTRPARPMALRDDLLVKLQAVDAGDASAVRKAFAARHDRARSKLELYDRLRDRLLAGRSSDEYVRDAERIGPYFTLMGGRMLEEQNMRLITDVLAVLDRREGGERP